MSSLLNISNGSSWPEKFSLSNIEALVDSKEQNWSKRAQFLGLKHIDTSVGGLGKCKMPTRNDIKATPYGTGDWSGPKDHQNQTNKFLSVFGVMHVIIKS